MLRGTMLGLVGLVCVFAGGCASNDEALAEKDRVIQEKTQANEGLQAQVSTMSQTQLVMQRQLNEKDRTIESNKAPKPVTPSGDDPSLLVDKPTAKGNKHAGGAAKAPAADLAVKDPHVHIETRKNGETVVRVASPFAAGSTTLTKEGTTALAKVAAELKKSNGHISIEGHTDASVLTGKNKERYGDNMNLSLARATAVKKYLVDTGKLPTSRISVTGHGDTQPIDKTKGKDANEKNRRVEIVVAAE